MKNKIAIDNKGMKKMVIVLILMFLWLMPLFGSDLATDWTWVHRKNFTESIRTVNGNKKVLFFTQDNVSPFTQLVFSWNVVRPAQGYFSFFVQVRDAATKKWGLWHHMVDWGKDVQKSYLSKSDGFSSYVHVRLETDYKKGADAFRIKVEPKKAASLSLVYGICVALSDFTLFKAEEIKDKEDFLSSVYVANIPCIAQLALEHEDNARICSPVSCSMVVHYMTGNYIDPLDFAARSFDTGLSAYGSWGCNTAHAFEHSQEKFNFFVRRMNTFADVHQQLVQGLPVVVSIRGNLPGALKSFPHGHLLVIVGWDNATREVLCHDPAAESHAEVFKKYPLEHFLRAWERSHRLSYIVEPVSCGVGKG